MCISILSKQCLKISTSRTRTKSTHVRTAMCELSILRYLEVIKSSFLQDGDHKYGPHYNRTDIEVTGEQIASGIPGVLQVRRGKYCIYFVHIAKSV